MLLLLFAGPPYDPTGTFPLEQQPGPVLPIFPTAFYQATMVEPIPFLGNVDVPSIVAFLTTADVGNVTQFQNIRVVASGPGGPLVIP